jgi:hypothetical protein
MEPDEMVGDDETKTTIKIPTDLLDDFKHLAIDMTKQESKNREAKHRKPLWLD